MLNAVLKDTFFFFFFKKRVGFITKERLNSWQFFKQKIEIKQEMGRGLIGNEVPLKGEEVKVQGSFIGGCCFEKTRSV